MDALIPSSKGNTGKRASKKRKAKGLIGPKAQRIPPQNPANAEIDAELERLLAKQRATIKVMNRWRWK